MYQVALRIFISVSQNAYSVEYFKYALCKNLWMGEFSANTVELHRKLHKNVNQQIMDHKYLLIAIFLIFRSVNWHFKLCLFLIKTCCFQRQGQASALIPNQGSYRNVLPVNYLKGWAISETFPDKADRRWGAVCSLSRGRHDEADTLACVQPIRANLLPRPGCGWWMGLHFPGLEISPRQPPPSTLRTAWTGDTSVYLFISFNTLLYLLHC